jgi:hypothetical protein
MNTFPQISKSFTGAITAPEMLSVISTQFLQQYPTFIKITLELTSLANLRVFCQSISIAQYHRILSTCVKNGQHVASLKIYFALHYTAIFVPRTLIKCSFQIQKSNLNGSSTQWCSVPVPNSFGMMDSEGKFNPLLYRTKSNI